LIWYGKAFNIQRSAREIAKTYGLLKPQGTALTGAFAWLDQLLDLAESPNLILNQLITDTDKAFIIYGYWVSDAIQSGVI
jgi:hypothetical protein